MVSQPAMGQVHRVVVRIDIDASAEESARRQRLGVADSSTSSQRRPATPTRMTGCPVPVLCTLAEAPDHSDGPRTTATASAAARHRRTGDTRTTLGDQGVLDPEALLRGGHAGKDCRDRWPSVAGPDQFGTGGTGTDVRNA
jgi:hypothetical protein